MINTPDAALQQPSEYSKALTLKRKLDLAIREEELKQITHNMRAAASGRESMGDYSKSIGKHTAGGAVAGAAVGGVLSVPASLLSKGFRSLRHKPVGMATVAAGTTLGALGLGARRAKQGRKQIFPRYATSELNQLRYIREELKNPESPVYHAHVRNNKRIPGMKGV